MIERDCFDSTPSMQLCARIVNVSLCPLSSSRRENLHSSFLRNWIYGHMKNEFAKRAGARALNSFCRTFGIYSGRHYDSKNTLYASLRFRPEPLCAFRVCRSFLFANLDQRMRCAASSHHQHFRLARIKYLIRGLVLESK